LNKVTWWLYALREDRRYTWIELAKRDGSKPRQIHAPIKPIKDMQRALASVLAGCYEPPVNVHGFVHGRSPVSNARQHQKQKWVLKVDLEDFFPSINFGRVRGMFMAFPFEYPPEVATLLAQLCCYRNQLPQGAPTSPIVSNFICRRLDVQLARIARDERCYYTRYADDICLSTNRKTFPGAWQLGTVEASCSVRSCSRSSRRTASESTLPRRDCFATLGVSA
jgi:RNA-directed DNA polymerase